MPEIPFCNTPKNPIFITVSSLNSLKKTFFLPNYVGFFGFSLSWSEFHRENRKARSFPSLSHLSLSPSSISSCPSFALSSFSIKLSLLPSPLYFLPLTVLSPFHFSPPVHKTPKALCLQFWALVFFFSNLTMKKMKGVAAAMNSPSPSYATIYEDPRIMLKHQSLMQDYEELYKETEAKKRKLQMMRQKKLTLMAEVRFLRRRYKFLTQNKSKKAPKERSFVQPQNLVAASKNLKKEKSYSVNNAALRPPVPRFDLNQKGKVCIEREAILRNSTPIFDLNRKQMTHIGKEAALRKTATIPDLNQKERIYRGKEAKVQNNTPIFDLNEISREEEELQVNGDMLRAEELKIISVRGGGDELNNDMKLSACRNVGNGSSRAGKRKITWQDQVALRV